MSAPPTPGKQEATVISFVDIPSSTPGRIGKQDTLVTYQLDPMHTFQVVLAKETATPQAIDAAVRQDFMSRKDLINRKISVG